MEDDTRQVLINVYAGTANGEAIHEELPAIYRGNGTYELLSSPGLALNLARGDWVAIPDQNKPAEVLRRGGNFCIQIYSDEMPNDEIERLEHEVGHKLHGTLDGVYEGNLSLAVPASVGMEEINKFFDEFTRRTGKQWFYANIYKNFEDVDDETLLNWWFQ